MPCPTTAHMDLQLGLALPTNSLKYGFEPKENGFKPKVVVGFEPWRSYGCCKNKRGFDQAFEDDTEHVTQMLLWNDQPNDDDHKGHEEKFTCSIDGFEDEGNGIVGWPPINSWRKKLHNHHHQPYFHHHHRQQQLQQQQQRGCVRNDPSERNGYCESNSMYVKVNMEGVAIGRKVNLSLHQSYQTLMVALIGMFKKFQKDMKVPTNGEEPYTLTYQPRDGEWLFVGDVPWQTFIRSVQRLKLKRNCSG